jgi:ketopantoate reductase
MRRVVLGASGVGGLVGGMLAKAGHNEGAARYHTGQTEAEKAAYICGICNPLHTSATP